MQQLSGASHAAGANFGPIGQRSQIHNTVSTDQCVRGFLARWHGGNFQFGMIFGRQIFQAMNRQIDF